MPSLVDRTREVVAAESDNFFADDTILFYLNKSQELIVSYLIQLEENRDKSLRALDKLRKYKDLSVNLLTFIDHGDYFSAEINFPSTDPINQFMYAKYDPNVVMREISMNDRPKLEWGNLRTSQEEAYYMIIESSNGNTAFRIFTESDDSTTNKNLRIYYITDPTELQSSDTEMIELPSRLENALIYGAAKLMVSQESIHDQIGQQAIKIFQSTYQEELQANTY